MVGTWQSRRSGVRSAVAGGRVCGVRWPVGGRAECGPARVPDFQFLRFVTSSVWVSTFEFSLQSSDFSISLISEIRISSDFEFLISKIFSLSG
jgi:hypothetical protein